MKTTHHFAWSYACLAVLVIIPSLAQAQVGSKGEPPQGTKREWYNGDREEWVWVVGDEIAVLHDMQTTKALSAPNRAQAINGAVTAVIPGAKVAQANEAVTFYTLPRVQTAETMLEARRRLHEQSAIKYTSPVGYPGARSAESRMALTGEIIVHFKTSPSNSELGAFADKHGIHLLQGYSFSTEIFLFDARGADDCLALANKIHLSGAVRYAYPNWLRSYAARGLSRQAPSSSEVPVHSREILTNRPARADAANGQAVYREETETAREHKTREHKN